MKHQLLDLINLPADVKNLPADFLNRESELKNHGLELTNQGAVFLSTAGDVNALQAENIKNFL